MVLIGTGLELNISMIGQKIDQNINFMYHLYSGAFEELPLQNVDREIWVHVPRCLWDVDCEHYHLCMHELAWKQFCIACMSHVLRSVERLHPLCTQGKWDALDTTAWFGMHTNAVDVITSMYCKLNLSDLLQASIDNHDEMFDIFLKYIKRRDSHGT